MTRATLLVDAYGGELFVENAGSGINHETVYHNSIRVAGSDQVPYGNNAVQQAQPMAGTPHERGRVTAVQMNPAYTYVATDFSNAYSDAVVPAPKSGKVTREVVVVYPDMVVVRDRVIGSGNLDVLFHVWSGAGTLDAGARTLTVARPAGRGWLKTMFPTNATMQVSAQGATDLLTVRAPGAASAVDFLHLIYLSPTAGSVVPGDVTPIDTATQIGVSLRDRQGRPVSVAFHRTGVGLAGATVGGTPPVPPTKLRIIR